MNLLIRSLQFLVAIGLLLCAAQAHAGAAVDASAVKDLQSQRGYLAVSPAGIGGAVGPSIGTGPRYLWGIEGGYHYPIGPSLMIQPGLVFEHGAFRQEDAPSFEGALARPRWGHLIRVGPQVRIGGGNPRLFGYGLLSVTPAVFVLDRVSGNRLERVARPALSSTVGLGVQGLIARRVLVGGEANFDFVAANLVLRARLYVGVMF